MISTSTKCASTSNLECNNYNYLYNYDYKTFLTLIGNRDESYTYLFIDSGAINTARASKGYRIYPVIYLDSEILYLSGNGTLENPYILR